MKLIFILTINGWRFKARFRRGRIVLLGRAS
jgi:hypothetical protein